MKLESAADDNPALVDTYHNSIVRVDVDAFMCQFSLIPSPGMIKRDVQGCHVEPKTAESGPRPILPHDGWRGKSVPECSPSQHSGKRVSYKFLINFMLIILMSRLSYHSILGFTHTAEACSPIYKTRTCKTSSIS